MTIRPIIEVPDKRLKTVSQPVAEVTDDTRALMDDMLDTMYDANGIGLAAIQVGVADRVIVMDISRREQWHGATEDDPEEADTGETGPRF
ncbi:MAG: peptide deformylase, partial [Pseudomonadota bacterium]|nr:peptide deformylase [Pseudomonadota bacterium]